MPKFMEVLHKSEARGARWSEIDFDKRVWTIPASRMKTRREHQLPLSGQAIELLRDLQVIGPMPTTLLSDIAKKVALAVEEHPEFSGGEIAKLTGVSQSYAYRLKGILKQANGNLAPLSDFVFPALRDPAVPPTERALDGYVSRKPLDIAVRNMRELGFDFDTLVDAGGEPRRRSRRSAGDTLREGQLMARTFVKPRKHRSTGHVRKSKSPAHVERPWVAEYYDQLGRRHQPRYGTKREAEAHLVSVLGDVKRGTHTPKHGSPTIAEMAEEHLERLGSGVDALEATTIKSYRSLLKLHILPQIGHLKLSEFTMPVCTEYRDWLVKKCGFSLAKSTWSYLARVLDHAMRKEVLFENVVRRAEPITRNQRHIRKLKVGRDVPTVDEVRAILNYIERFEGPYERAFFAMLAMTGMRSGEVRGLTWSNIDFERQVLQVSQRANSIDRIGSPKTFAAHREIPLPAYLIDALKEWRVRCPYKSGTTSLRTTAAKAQEIARYVMSDPSAPNRVIARAVRCYPPAVTKVREALGLPGFHTNFWELLPIPEFSPDDPYPDLPYHDAKLKTSVKKAKEIARVLVAQPELTNKLLSRKFAVKIDAVAQIRALAGLPPSPIGRRPHQNLTPPPENLVLPFFVRPKDGEEDLVFPNYLGKVKAYETIRKKMAEIQKKAGVVDRNGNAKYSHLHRFRHFYATVMLEDGGTPIKRLQTILGHAHATHTLDRYGHFIPDYEGDQARAARLADKLGATPAPLSLQRK